MSADRMWSPTWGMGNMDFLTTIGKATFTQDSGGSIVIVWVEARLGPASKAGMPRRKVEREEWEKWRTLTTEAGEMFSFRRDGPPPKGSGQ